MTVSLAVSTQRTKVTETDIQSARHCTRARAALCSLARLQSRGKDDQCKKGLVIHLVILPCPGEVLFLVDCVRYTVCYHAALRETVPTAIDT